MRPDSWSDPEGCRAGNQLCLPQNSCILAELRGRIAEGDRARGYRAPFAVTEAVKVTTVGHATEDEEIVSVVVVGKGAACAAVATLQAAVSNTLEITRRNGTIRLQAEKGTFPI